MDPCICWYIEDTCIGWQYLKHPCCTHISSFLRLFGSYSWTIFEQYLNNIFEQYLNNIWSIRVARITFLPSWGYQARCTIFEQYLNNIWTIFELYLNNSWTIFEQYFKQLFCTSYISSFYLARCNLSRSSPNIFSSFSSIYESHLN